MDLFISILFDAFITALAYLLVPLIIFIIGKQLTLSQIKKTSLINGLSVLVIIMIIRYEMGVDEPFRVVGILWAQVGYFILKKKCLKDEHTSEHINTEPKVNENMRYSLSKEDETPKSYGSYNVYGKDIMLEKPPNQEDTIPHIDEYTKAKILKILEIDNETNNKEDRE